MNTQGTAPSEEKAMVEEGETDTRQHTTRSLSLEGLDKYILSRNINLGCS